MPAFLTTHVFAHLTPTLQDQKVDSASADANYEALSKYGTDLTANAAHLDPVIGRDDEIRRVIRILSRRTKNNPVLVGEVSGPGCLLWAGHCLVNSRHHQL